ncbi:phage portal protein [Burkholderia gladioli]|uniref:phage portal protein n=1 Tax=Burkholderia gladioli TaxID=28095 RepID=UPI00164073E1|nr:phage portal protein [Burkholderia gladioli]
MGFFAKSAGPGVIDSPQALADMIGLSYESLTGVNVSADTAMRFSTVFSCVRVISESLGMLPCSLKRRVGETRSNASDHPVDRIIRVAANEFMTTAEWNELVGLTLAQHGNFYAWKNVVRDELRELLPLNPACVTPELDAAWNVTYQVTFPSGATRTLGASEVLHIRLFARDGLTGINPIQYNRETIGLGIAAERQGARWFKQGTRISGVLSTDGSLKDDAYKRIRADWERTYSGDENAWKVAILEAGLKFQPVAMSAADVQWLEGRKMQRSEICGLYRVPPHKIGDLERATFTNIEQQSLDFVIDCMVPYVVKIEQRYAASLLSPKDQAEYYAHFNLNALMRADMQTRSNFYMRMQQCGALSANEIRALEDLNPREGGDVYLTPVNMAVNGGSGKDKGNGS